ncbi:hypothetical protein EZS27_001299 [termite gut metagenome]|jgi:hypothetical protein|uniref:Uncharacterized protein n=1 Tax=termite gut metagenome TaxID=433724 RepID=A0A5J4SYK1_9ZZZZ
MNLKYFMHLCKMLSQLELESAPFNMAVTANYKINK